MKKASSRVGSHPTTQSTPFLTRDQIGKTLGSASRTVDKLLRRGHLKTVNAGKLGVRVRNHPAGKPILLGSGVCGSNTPYLSREQAVLLLGPAGSGKSTLLFQMAMHFAAGLPWCGIAPDRPLRVLFVCNEKWDTREAIDGIVDEFCAHEKSRFLDLTDDNLAILDTQPGLSGDQYSDVVLRPIFEHRADLVVMDPLSFPGVTFSREAEVSQLLRAWVNPALRATGSGMICSCNAGMSMPVLDGALLEEAYHMVESPVLLDWAWATMVLRYADNHGTFKLVLGKRGKLAGARHPDGSVAETLWMRHTRERGVYWKPINPPGKDAPLRKN